MGGRREIVSPETVLPVSDLVFFLLETIPGLDLSAFYGYYTTEGPRATAVCRTDDRNCASGCLSPRSGSNSS